MMIQAVLGNPNHPEYGVATIPFPIPHDQYAHCMELLEALEIGDAVKVDCKVEKIDSFYTVLKRTEMLTVNVEELNYLAKRLDSFDTGEAAQFQASSQLFLRQRMPISIIWTAKNRPSPLPSRALPPAFPASWKAAISSRSSWPIIRARAKQPFLRSCSMWRSSR